MTRFRSHGPLCCARRRRASRLDNTSADCQWSRRLPPAGESRMRRLVIATAGLLRVDRRPPRRRPPDGRRHLPAARIAHVGAPAARRSSARTAASTPSAGAGRLVAARLGRRHDRGRRRAAGARRADPYPTLHSVVVDPEHNRVFVSDPNRHALWSLRSAARRRRARAGRAADGHPRSGDRHDVHRRRDRRRARRRRSTPSTTTSATG